MRLFARLEIGYLLLAAGLLVAVIFLSASQANAHGAGGGTHIAVTVQDIDQEQAGSSHIEHCHGSSLCGGFAVLIGNCLSMRPSMQISRPDMPLALLRPYMITGFDPPPPRYLS
ncbi:hypothetical protein ETW23_07860 [Leisingera sp. NJS201]|uniref:hypothetical protein n=1 Tax=Leisingera sp. NJS201 TaxID=2508306 RepID=UPI00107080F8|nr:hypothetical protein [Leisingera sp. NJS201]QBR36068.1 hypothetical protein ETW23_07860 [Leisingera sp. NJS201]